MKSISFKNFRRFAVFPEFKFGDITILVGGNNVGKSTLVKALLLVLDNLKTMRRDFNSGENIFDSTSNPEFRFDENTFHELNIKNFNRALNRHCTGEDRITFNLCVEHPLTNDTYEFEIVVSKYNKKGEVIESNDDARGLIDFIRVNNITKGIQFDFSFSNWNGEAPYMYVRIVDDAAKEIESRIESLKQEKAEITQSIKEIEPRLNEMSVLEPGIIGKLNDRKAGLKKIDMVLKEALADKSKAKDVEAKIPFAPTLDQSSKYLILDLIKDIISYAGYSSTEKKGSKAYNAEVRIKELLNAYRSKMQEVSEDIRYLLDFFGVDYIQAHGVTQKTLFSTSDNTDHIAKTVKEFMQSRAWRNQQIRQFIRDWMERFKIGYDFKIKDEDGEAFKVFILESPEDKSGFPLADLGMGSIQLMMLLFALASSIKRNIGSVFGKPTVVIEEPEQNLHPMVQSRLADLIFDINSKFGLRFIIETHSEYLIRRSQVLVAEQCQNDLSWIANNPFRVYYFPNDGIPYDMVYQTNGHFEESFGEGFFDEAGKWTRELMRNKRR